MSVSSIVLIVNIVQTMGSHAVLEHKNRSLEEFIKPVNI